MFVFQGSFKLLFFWFVFCFFQVYIGEAVTYDFWVKVKLQTFWLHISIEKPILCPISGFWLILFDISYTYTYEYSEYCLGRRPSNQMTWIYTPWQQIPPLVVIFSTAHSTGCPGEIVVQKTVFSLGESINYSISPISAIKDDTLLLWSKNLFQVCTTILRFRPIRLNYAMPVPIIVKVTFLCYSIFLRCFSSVLNVNFRAKLVQRILHFAFSLRLWVLWETRPLGLKRAEKTSRKPQVFELVSTTAYSHLHVNGLYGPERWTAPIGVIYFLNSYS